MQVQPSPNTSAAGSQPTVKPRKPGWRLVLGRVSITATSIEADRDKIRSLAALPCIRLRRDKNQGHFDKKYFFDRTRLHNEAAITWNELDAAADVMGSMLND